MPLIYSCIFVFTLCFPTSTLQRIIEVVHEMSNAVVPRCLNVCLFPFDLRRCLNQCTYCKTKHARGELGSYPPEEIVDRARQSFEGMHLIH